MLKERRDWIQDYRANHGGKPPEDLKDYYDRMNVEQPLTPEEAEAKRLQEEEEAKAKKKKKKDKEKKKKGKKKKGDDDDDGPAVIITGPSEVVQKFDEFQQDYNEVWGNKDESEKFDMEMARADVMPEVEEEFKQAVDDMIKVELENMRLLGGFKSKKKKKGKKKKKKKKKGKKKKLPGEKQIDKMDIKDILVELVQHGIVKKLAP